VIFARVHQPASPAAEPAEPDPSPIPPRPALDTAADVSSVNRWALPLSFLVALLLNASGCGRLVIYSSAGNWTHELGHASWRWLNGRSAFPALFFTFYAEPGRSVLSALLVLAGLVGLFLWARTADCVGLMRLAVLFGALFLGFTIAIPAPRERLLESFAGIFGEFWISTLWVVLFYYRFPDSVRWTRLRWAFLFLGAGAFVHILRIFWISRDDMSLLPWGSFFGGDGDLDQLLAAGWLVPTIRRVYFTTAAVCAAIITAHYLYFLRGSAPLFRRASVSPPAS
jgi:hypothetical protein